MTKKQHKTLDRDFALDNLDIGIDTEWEKGQAHDLYVKVLLGDGITATTHRSDSGLPPIVSKDKAKEEMKGAVGRVYDAGFVLVDAGLIVCGPAEDYPDSDDPLAVIAAMLGINLSEIDPDKD